MMAVKAMKGESTAGEKDSKADRVIIFDTTLRDGEQSPGATLTVPEKIRLARQLALLGVDVIEAGFPVASRDDFLAVRGIAERVGSGVSQHPGGRPPVICGLARANRSDIDAAWEAVRPAARPRIHTFLATSDIHIEHKLRSTRGEVLDQIRDAVEYARSLCDDVEFSPEDASRTDRGFLCQAVSTAIAAGATTINIPDTVGYSTPGEFGDLIRHLRAEVEGIDRIIVSVHCHDDLGLATANTLAALQAGACQAEVTVNGIGERAGNAALEEVVMLCDTRAEVLGLATGVDLTQIARTSRMVSETTGLRIQPNKAIVGANAFAHESGIHQDGLLKHQATYEIIRPETVGLVESRLVLGKHSGRHAFRVHLADLGYEVDDETLNLAFEAFKTLADKKKTVADADIEALLADVLERAGDGFQLIDLQVVSGRPGMPTATVRLLDPQGAEHISAAVGVGPVDAAYRSINQVIDLPSRLREYNVHGVTEGIDAQGRVTVQLEDGQGRIASGYGADTDIIVASAKAYLSALNRLAATIEQSITAGAEAGNP
ncbi:MAG: 2-isopropylmalate synthase [Candidatus Bipolaricaulota bacterium]